MSESDVEATPHVSRRRVITMVVGAVAGGTALLVGANALATKSPSIRGCTDSDRGGGSDAPGDGRGNGRSDSDAGRTSDPPGCGRR